MKDKNEYASDLETDMFKATT